MATITATFETRAEADLAIEHLVQEQEIDRGDILVESDSDENTVGTIAGGADVETDFEDGAEDEAALNGSVKLTVTLDNEDLVEDLEEVLYEFGASDVVQE